MNYIVLEYRERHAAQDIQASCDKLPQFKLVFVLESECVLVFERVE